MNNEIHYTYTNLGTAAFPSYQVFAEIWVEVGSDQDDSYEEIGPKHMSEKAAIAFIEQLTK